ncbi:MAG TPA: hypothetical protein VM597_16495 [Gemmataceae bacterium]|nr:hypothetical protein [Gemmataceae bacterium]
MPAKINILTGPDNGRSFHLSGAEVRIGRGGNSQVSLRDPAMTGTLRVECRNALYFVHNETGSAVYLDGHPFPPGERRPWYHTGRLQPTADTVIELEVVDAPTGVQAGPVVEAVPTGTTPQGKRLQILVIAVCVPIALAGFLMDSKEGSGKPDTDVRKQYEKVEAELRDLAARPGPGGRAAAATLPGVRQGRLDEVRTNRHAAFGEYRNGVRELDAALANSSTPVSGADEETLKRARTFLNDRMLKLAAAGAGDPAR